MSLYVLGIESSCDETGVAVCCAEKGLLAHVLHSQVETHRAYGGVVPELASRNHILHIADLVDEALRKAGLTKQSIGAIAYTAGPGLIGALLVGASFAKSLGFALNIPTLAVHHLEAHLLAAKLDDASLEFPFTALLVSGGHTQLLAAHKLGHYTLIGETLDDACGEAFDKTAKLMGLSYPGGPVLAKLADEANNHPNLPEIAPFPRPMLDRPNCEMSFSGLKTHAMTVWNKSTQTEADRMAIAKAFQESVVDTLCEKTARALKETGHKSLVIAGGVGANLALRSALKARFEPDVKLYFPSLEYCTDNGAMVAYAGSQHLLQGKHDKNHAITVHARWPLVAYTD